MTIDTSGRTPEWVTAIGAAIFVFILFISAVFEADIRWLHFFQAMMYVVAVWPTFRRNVWGYLIGISAAAFWDYVNLFVNNFLMSGIHHLWTSIETGKLSHPDQIFAVPAWLGNLLVVIGCFWAYRRYGRPVRQDIARFVLAFALMAAFFAADMWLFQPRYLVLFARALHPHWPRSGQ